MDTLTRDLRPYFPDGRVPHDSTINRWVRAGKFPAPLRTSARWKAWRQSDIEAWMRGEYRPTSGAVAA